MHTKQCAEGYKEKLISQLNSNTTACAFRLRIRDQPTVAGNGGMAKAPAGLKYGAYEISAEATKQGYRVLGL